MRPTVSAAEYAVVNESFTNAEIAEDHVQNIFDIDPAGEPAKRRRGRSQFLGDQLLVAGLHASAKARSSAATVSSSAWRWRARVTMADSVAEKYRSA